MPPYRREMPASAAASLNVAQERVISDESRTVARPAPSPDPLAAEQEADCGDRAYVVVFAFGSPTCNAGVEDSVGQRKEHLHIFVETVVVAARDELREGTPVAGRSFRSRAIRPIFGDHLLTVAEIGADVQQFQRLPAVRPAEECMVEVEIEISDIVWKK